MPPKKSDNKLSWVEALKVWNKSNNAHTWCVPKMKSHTMGSGWASKTTPEYDQVKYIQKHGVAKGSAPKKPSKKGKEAATSASAVEEYKAAMAMHGARLKGAGGAVASTSSAGMVAAPERVPGAKGKGRIVLG